MADIPLAADLAERGATLDDLKVALADRLLAANPTMRKVENGDRLLASEQRTHDRHLAEVRALNQLITDHPDHDPDPEGSEVVRKVRFAPEPGSRAGRTLTDLTGAELVLDRSRSLADWSVARGEPAHDDGATLAGVIRGLTWGVWGEAEQRAMANSRRAQDSTTGSGGGFLMPSGLSMQVLDQARNAARVLQAGATTVPMPTAEYSIAKVAGDPTASWRKPSAAIASTEASFEMMTFVAKSLSALVRIPLELVEDTSDGGGRQVETLLRRLLAETIAQEVDRVALLGDGDAGEPVGLLNTAGVSSTALSAAPTNWDFVVQRAGDVEDDNHVPTGAITSPRVGRQMGLLKDTTNQPLRRPERVNYPVLETNQVPVNLGAGTDESLFFVGQWEQLMVGVRTQLRLVPLRERFMDTGEIGIVAWFRGDIGVARTDAFSVQTAVTAA